MMPINTCAITYMYMYAISSDVHTPAQFVVLKNSKPAEQLQEKEPGRLMHSSVEAASHGMASHSLMSSHKPVTVKSTRQQESPALTIIVFSLVSAPFLLAPPTTFARFC